jgi:hypothetical protein
MPFRASSHPNDSKAMGSQQMNQLPIIRLEVERMQYQVRAMLTEHTAMMDAQVKSALDDALRPECIEGVIRRTVRQCVDEAVTSEIQQFFRYSAPGRQAIRQAVQEHMDAHFGDKAND